MTNMGARVARMFRNVNLENRAMREISKEKPVAAPRHKTEVLPEVRGVDETEVTESIHVKNDPLLSLLKTVYVQSKDPAQASQPPPPQRPSEEDAERRPLKFSLPGDQFGLPEITDVPKGRLSLVEALKALNAHKTSPATWTAQKVAEEYCLALHHTEALLKFFVPFDVMIIPPKSDAVKEIKDS